MTDKNNKLYLDSKYKKKLIINTDYRLSGIYNIMQIYL